MNIYEESQIRAAHIMEWFKTAGVEASCIPHSTRVWDLELRKDGHVYVSPSVTLGDGLPDSWHIALDHLVGWLYPILEPEGWDEGFEQEVSEDTIALRSWLISVDHDGVIRAGIEYVGTVDADDRLLDELNDHCFGGL